MEALIQKTTAIVFRGKSYVLPNEVTIGEFLKQLYVDEDSILIRPIKDGFRLELKN